jgi:hypothetical protein
MCDFLLFPVHELFRGSLGTFGLISVATKITVMATWWRPMEGLLTIPVVGWHGRFLKTIVEEAPEGFSSPHEMPDVLALPVTRCTSFTISRNSSRGIWIPSIATAPFQGSGSGLCSSALLGVTLRVVRGT